MSNPSAPEPNPVAESSESFEDILSQYEKSHSRKKEDGGKQIEATVIAVSTESVFFDIGFKTEGIMPLAVFQSAGHSVKPGDKMPVSVKGRDPEGYYELSRQKIAQPTDWSSLEQAFAGKATIVGTVTGIIKGDATDEDVVVDRRALAEEEERGVKERRYSEIREGEIVRGTVRSLTDYGAFIDLGGVDGLLHVGEIAWSRINKPADVLSLGQEIEARVLKVDPERRRI